MKRKLFCMILAVLCLLPGCGQSRAAETDDGTLKAAATTYPVYLLAQAVTEGVDGVSVSLVIDQQVSCLHDYTLTMRDMEAVERADVLLINGAGLEDFLDSILDDSDIIDSSDGTALQPCAGDHDDLGGLRRLYLTDVQGVVVQAGDAFRHQSGDGEGRTLAEPGGKFIHGQGRSGNLCRLRLRPASTEQHQQSQQSRE